MKFKKLLSTVCASTMLFSSIFCCKAVGDINVTFVGDSCTGKTTIIKKLIGSQNTASDITTFVKSYDCPTATNQTAVLYDTHGLEDYIEFLKASFPKTTDVLIICLDSNPDTYQARLRYWLDFVSKNVPQAADAKKVVVLYSRTKNEHIENEHMSVMRCEISRLVGSCPIIPCNATDDAGITILRDYLSNANSSLPLQRCAATCAFKTST